MRTVRSIFALVCVLVALDGHDAFAQRNAPAPYTVPASWLAAHLKDPNLVVLQVGGDDDYPAKHIPGAHLVGLDDISTTEMSATGQMLEMLPTDKMHDSFAKLGIGDNSRIVVYFAKEGVASATRVVYTLFYAGLGDKVSLLDGGMEAWTRDGNQLTNVLPPAQPGKLAALVTKPVVVDAAYVRAHIGKPGVSIVDGRASAFYDGVQHGNGHSGPHRSGHIASAKSVPYTEVTDSKLLVKSVGELNALFAKAGVAPTDTIIGYCHIGQQATEMLFAARITGHPVVLYDGSFDDWSRHADYPVDNPSAKRKP